MIALLIKNVGQRNFCRALPDILYQIKNKTGWKAKVVFEVNSLRDSDSPRD